MLVLCSPSVHKVYYSSAETGMGSARLAYTVHEQKQSALEDYAERAVMMQYNICVVTLSVYTILCSGFFLLCSIMPLCSDVLLCSKLCQHNLPRPIRRPCWFTARAHASLISHKPGVKQCTDLLVSVGVTVRVLLHLSGCVALGSASPQKLSIHTCDDCATTTQYYVTV